MKRSILIISIIVCLAIGCTNGSATIEENENGQAVVLVATVEVATTLPTLIDLGADKCVPCKMMAPLLEELRETYTGKMQVTFYDVWKNPEKGKAYGIRAIPTQLFLDRDGKELYRHIGYYSKEAIMAKWRELGYDFEEE